MDSLPKPSVLIVDNHPENLTALETMLKPLDCSLIKATSGNEALSLALKNDLAAILVDVRLPNMDGFEVADSLIKDEKTQNIPIVFMSSYEKSFTQALQAYTHGTLDYLIKPIDPHVVCSKVSMLCELYLKQHVDKRMNTLAQNNKILKKLATFDHLTKIPNRLYFDIELSKQIDRAKRYQHQFSLMLMDIDYFKIVNDTFGHEAGDQLLISLAERINSHIRSGDILARLGGDEFAIIVEQINDYQDVELFAQKIMRIVQEPFQIVESEIQITLSIGITCFPEHGDNAKELFNKADTTLYQVKESGRNAYKFY